MATEQNGCGSRDASNTILAVVARQQSTYNIGLTFEATTIDLRFGRICYNIASVEELM